MKRRYITGFLMFIVVILIVALSGCVFQHGTSRDITQGFDKGIIWHHAYLKNDHTTAYCFDDESFIPLLKQSQKEQKEVIVTYETYGLRGSLCTVSEKFDTVVITNVELMN